MIYPRRDTERTALVPVRLQLLVWRTGLLNLPQALSTDRHDLQQVPFRRCMHTRVTSKFGEEKDGHPADCARGLFPRSVAVEGESCAYQRAAPPGGKIGMRRRMHSAESKQLCLQENKAKLDSIARRGHGSRQLQQEAAAEICILRVEFCIAVVNNEGGRRAGRWMVSKKIDKQRDSPEQQLTPKIEKLVRSSRCFPGFLGIDKEQDIHHQLIKTIFLHLRGARNLSMVLTFWLQEEDRRQGTDDSNDLPRIGVEAAHETSGLVG